MGVVRLCHRQNISYIFGYVEKGIEVVLLDTVQVVETIVGVIVHV